MKKGMSIGLYRFIDLTIFSILMAVFEFISVKALSWFSEIYYVSVFFTIVLITMRRWQFWAIIPATVSAIIYCYLNDGVLINYIVYIGGNAFILFDLFFIKFRKGKMNDNYIVVSYIIFGYLLVEIGRSLIALCFGSPFFSTLIGFLGVESLSGLLAILIILITKKQDGIFEEQISYLKRIKEEEKESSEV